MSSYRSFGINWLLVAGIIVVNYQANAKIVDSNDDSDVSLRVLGLKDFAKIFYKLTDNEARDNLEGEQVKRNVIASEVIKTKELDNFQKSTTQSSTAKNVEYWFVTKFSENGTVDGSQYIRVCNLMTSDCGDYYRYEVDKSAEDEAENYLIETENKNDNNVPEIIEYWFKTKISQNGTFDGVTRKCNLMTSDCGDYYHYKVDESAENEISNNSIVNENNENESVISEKSTESSIYENVEYWLETDIGENGNPDGITRKCNLMTPDCGDYYYYKVDESAVNEISNNSIDEK